MRQEVSHQGQDNRKRISAVALDSDASTTVRRQIVAAWGFLLGSYGSKGNFTDGSIGFPSDP